MGESFQRAKRSSLRATSDAQLRGAGEARRQQRRFAQSGNGNLERSLSAQTSIDASEETENYSMMRLLEDKNGRLGESELPWRSLPLGLMMDDQSRPCL